MKLLVTGGCGFIGANLCEYLLDQGGYSLRVLDNLSTGRRGYLAQIYEHTGLGVEFIEGDIRDRGVVDQVTVGVDAVVHLAAKPSVVESLDHPQEVFQVNVMGTLNLLEACRQQGVSRFVLASSNAVLGEQSPPTHEQMVPLPVSPYGASKLACEGLCSAYHGSFGIEAVALRLSNVYGPYCDHKTGVIPAFIRRARQGQPLVIYGDGTQTRDFIHVNDVARAIELALTYKAGAENPQLAFQIGKGEPTEIREVAQRISKLAKEDRGQSVELDFRDARPGEIVLNYSNPNRARECLGFTAEVSLNEGLAGLWKRYAHNISSR
jgi:UDP-glucose 4-epimerase